MDEINAFFDFSKDFVRSEAPKGIISGNPKMVPIKKETRPMKRVFSHRATANEYAKEALLEEKRRLAELKMEDDDCDEFASVSEYGSECENPQRAAKGDDVYNLYHFDTQHNSELPIHDKKEEIISLIKNNPVVVLEGDTGCGKTTQVPQYIIGDAYTRQEYCNIICTQPRRIAAMSIAKRVCDERKWELGSVIGYQVGLHCYSSADTRILFCTTGVLLQKLVREKSLKGFTHIILDEVHERDQDMDFLLIIIRRLISTNSRHVKVILMSATIDTKLFANYFKLRNKSAPILRVDNRRQFNVRTFYLDELHRINNDEVSVDYEQPGISLQMYSIALKLILVIENIEKAESNNDEVASSILIFLPGINEIDILYKKLESFSLPAEFSDHVKFLPIRLHSLIPADEQIKIFKRSEIGIRKVILSTNIAESSITVPDVKYVIDFCLTKVLINDSSTSFSSLKLDWASRANCRQRAGRAGRVSNGRVYRLIPKYFYMNFLDEFGVPEMLRIPLETVVLKAKKLDMGAPANIIGLAINPPNLQDIQNTILTLKEVGALFTHVNGVYSEFDGDLSFFGHVMAVMPLDVRLTRLILFGFIFNVLEEAIIMAAGLSVRSIFKFNGRRPNFNTHAYIQKLIWADGSGSDLFAILKAYKMWRSLREHTTVGEHGEEFWAERFFINLRTMKEMNAMVQELKDRFAQFGIQPSNGGDRPNWLHHEIPIILKTVIAGAFYPNFFLRTNMTEADNERNVYHILCGFNPCNTVYFTNFNTRNIGPLYATSIKRLFEPIRLDENNIEVNFQPQSERVFITFKGNDEEDDVDNHSQLTVPGSVRPEVYKAIRMRYDRAQTRIRVMDPPAAIKYAEEAGLGKMEEGVWKPNLEETPHAELIVLPMLFVKQLRGTITHIINCGKFYFQPLSEGPRMQRLKDIINTFPHMDDLRFSTPAEISKDMLVIAPFGPDNNYYRAKIIKATSPHDHVQFKVNFIDYGNTVIVNFSALRRYAPEWKKIADIPPRCFECRLACISPSSFRSPSGQWCTEAIEFMQNKIDEDQLTELEIYSVVSGIASVTVNLKDGSLNNLLVDKGLARKSDENYMSKIDHDLRVRQQSAHHLSTEKCTESELKMYFRSLKSGTQKDHPPPPEHLCRKSNNLRGPFSPLETSLYSAIRIGNWKSASVESDSVNSVLLDTDPNDHHERLIVAAAITENTDKASLTARSTTLMPNIHGFSGLMAMLFCPKMQIRRSKNKSHFSSIIAGLGYNEETYESLYPEHDIIMNLDVEFIADDINMINHMRYIMDTMLYIGDGEEMPRALNSNMWDLTNKLKSLYSRILNRNRKYVEKEVDASDSYWEKQATKDLLTAGTNIYGNRCLFPPHAQHRLYSMRFEEMHALSEECKKLHHLRQFDGSLAPTICSLCNITVENINQLRVHLLSQLHLDREQHINFKPVKQQKKWK